MTGEAVRLLVRFGRRYATVVRLATLPPIAAIAFLRAAPANLPATATVVGVAVAWTCCCAWISRALTTTRADRRLLVADVAVLLAVCLSVFWTNAVDDTNTGWLRLLVTFACVTWQWHTPPLAGGIAAVVAGTGMLATVSVASGSLTVLPAQLWVLVVAALSRLAWVLVARAADRADRMTAEAEQARRAAAVAEAVRAEERELANALHDTAASTLLMVGTGQVPADAPWLTDQAARDLDRLRSGDRPRPRDADLVDLLRTTTEVAHLSIELHVPARLPLPFDIATAIADAAREAINNVRRHAGTDRATVSLHGDERAVRLEIADRGTGFRVEDVPPTRRGLRESVHGRMSRIGGAATITSAAGTGTLVRLEWGAGDG